MVGALSVVQRIPSVFNPLIGLFVERKDLRVFVILMPAITVITMSLIGVVENFWQLVILLFIMGWSSAFFHVPGPVLIKRVSGEKTGLGMSVYMLSAELGRSLGPIIIVAAVSWWGLGGTVWLIPVGLMASLLLFFRLRKIAPVHHEGVVNLISSWQLLKDLKAYYFVIAGYSFSQGLLKALLVTFLPTYYTNSGESLWFAAYTLSFFELAGAAGSLLSGTVSDKIGRGRALILIAILVPLIMVMFIFTNSWLNILALTLMGLVIFGSGPVLLALIQDVGAQRPGFSNGVYMTINFALGAVATVLVGFLSDIYGLEQIFMISPLFAMLTIPFAYRINALVRRAG